MQQTVVTVSAITRTAVPETGKGSASGEFTLALTDYCDPKNGTVAGDSESRDNGWTRMSLKLVLIMVLQAASLSLLPAVG